MSMFGSGYSKFIYSGSEVNLNHSNLDPTYFYPDEIEHESVLTGDSTYSTRSNKARFVVTEYLFKEGDPIGKLNEILNYKNYLVQFYPFANGDPISNRYLPSFFYITNIQPYFLYNPNQYDAVNITFEGQSDVDYRLYESSGWGWHWGTDWGH